MNRSERRAAERSGRVTSEGLFVPPKVPYDQLPPDDREVLDQLLILLIETLPPDIRERFGVGDDDQILRITRELIANGYVRLVLIKGEGYRIEPCPAALSLYHAFTNPEGSA